VPQQQQHNSKTGSNFFGRPDPPNAIRVGEPLLPSRKQSGSSPAPPSFPGATVLIDDVEVPRHSKMMKNSGLRLLQGGRRPDLSPPADQHSPDLRDEETTNYLREDDDSVTIGGYSGVSATVATSSHQEVTGPLVQGFRIKGDRNNRIVFLNLADLGLEPGTVFGQNLKIGAKELIPVEGLLSPIEGIPDAVLGTDADNAGDLDNVFDHYWGNRAGLFYRLCKCISSI
jgi:hypothetical protein